MGDQVTADQQKPLTAADWQTAKPITSADWETAKPIGGATPPPDVPKGPGQHPMAGFGRGITQSVMGTLIPLADLANRGTSWLGLEDRFAPDVFSRAKEDFATPKTTAENVGYWTGEAGQFALPGATAAKGLKLLPRAAAAIERRAVQTTPKIAEQLLESGYGRIAQKNAAALAKEARRTPVMKEVPKWSEKAQAWGHKTVRGPSKAQPMADAMANAVATKASPWSVQDYLNVTGRGLLGQYLMPGAPVVGAAIGAATKLAQKPRVTSAIAQGLHSAAPALSAIGGGGLSLAAAEYLKSLFGGSE
jgi:hypothetical protein